MSTLLPREALWSAGLCTALDSLGVLSLARKSPGNFPALLSQAKAAQGHRTPDFQQLATSEMRERIHSANRMICSLECERGKLCFMENQPVVAACQPVKVELEAGKAYFYCTCGRSATQPFCDGSHKGAGFSPQKFTAEKDGDAWLCQCKHTGNAPFCDGSHKKVGDLPG